VKRRRTSRAEESEDYFDFVDEGPAAKKRRPPPIDDYFDDDDEPAPPKKEPKPEKKPKKLRRLIDDLPEKIPILTKDDLLLHHSQEKGDGDRHHMTTWIELCLPRDFYSPSVRNRLAGAIMDLTWKTWGYNGIGPSFVPLDDQAAIWNAALRKLGYPVSQHNCLVLGPRRGSKKEK